ncbi:MAG: ABC transporter substrate-binding protein [Candidatus Tectomicrobia bacterium]|nr:ABC transporter substrate-binding protein [Candidatus Tectomicrobia bacterium]
MSRLRLNLACHVSDRTRALRDGSISIEGVELNWIALHVAEIFWRMCQYQEFDASEMSLGAHTTLTGKGNSPFVGVPVFPSRVFRHSGIFIRMESGVGRPEDLRGRRIGVPEYAMTACVVMRGILHHEYGVAPEEVVWVTGGQEVPGRKERVSLDLPPSIRIEPLPEDQTLNRALCEGGIDALFAAHPPSAFTAGDPRVRRLFPDYRPVEEDFFRRTGVFPIMHTLVIRRDVYEKNPWLAQSLLQAFQRAKEEVQRALGDPGWLTCMLPWSVAEMEATRRVMGEDFWPYGIEPNRKTLQTFCQYAFEQGLTPRRVAPEELFAPNTAERWKL